MQQDSHSGQILAVSAVMDFSYWVATGSNLGLVIIVLSWEFHVHGFFGETMMRHKNTLSTFLC